MTLKYHKISIGLGPEGRCFKKLDSKKYITFSISQSVHIFPKRKHCNLFWLRWCVLYMILNLYINSQPIFKDILLYIIALMALWFLFFYLLKFEIYLFFSCSVLTWLFCLHVVFHAYWSVLRSSTSRKVGSFLRMGLTWTSLYWRKLPHSPKPDEWKEGIISPSKEKRSGDNESLDQCQ